MIRLSWMTRLCGWCVLLSLAPVSTSAQTLETAPRARWELTPYVGVAWQSPAGTRLGVMPDRDHLFLGLHVTAAIIRRTRWRFAYAPDLVPLLVISNNPRYSTVTVATQSGERTFRFESGTGPVAGFAVAPIGLETQLSISPRADLFALGAIGGVWFTREVPVLDSRRFNYTFEYGGGVVWRLARGRALRFGYKFHHLSNANTARQNPGIDGNVFFAGLTLPVGGKR